jgi:sulfate permease, SulP family
VFDSRSKLPMADYAVVLLILAVVGSAGYMQGVAVGILAAVFLFIHNYSRVGIITHALTGAERQSNVDRPLMHQRILLELGAQTYVLKLQGFLFFGTANGLLNDIRNRLQDTALAPLRFVVLDFRRVSGLDSSATVSLLKAQRLAEQSSFYLVLTSLPAHVHSQLKKAGFQTERDGSCKLFRDLDHGIEWCEERILTPDLAGQIEAPTSLVAQLEQIWPNPGSVQKLMPYLERQTLDRGAYLIRQGDNSNCLYFVESGELTAQLEINDRTTHRLRRQGAGTVLGELGLFLGVPRTASVVAEMFSVVYRLSADSLRRLKAEDPHLAADFHEFLVRYLAERVVNCNRAIRAMSE